MPCFLCALNVGASAPNPDTRNFSGKVSWNFKNFWQNEVVWSVGNSFAYFSYKKSKRRRFGTQFQLLAKKEKTRRNPRFLCALSVGAVRPKPGHKKLFLKSFLWNFKNFRHNKSMYSVGNSFAYFSYKKSKCEILWHTFLIRKVCSFTYFSYLFLSRRYFAKSVRVSLSL